MPSHWVLVISRNRLISKNIYRTIPSLTQMLSPTGNNSNEISFLQGRLTGQSIPKGQSHAQQMDNTQ